MIATVERVETFVSTDIESDGPIPGVNSMLSFASVALDVDGCELCAFSANLIELPDARPDSRTMAWWRERPKAWAACRDNARDPSAAMADYDRWLKGLPGRPVFVAYPLLFDMMFVYWYQIRFVGSSPFSPSGIDIKTMAWLGMTGHGFRQATKRNMPKHWRPLRRHTHVALDDAREQGELFINIRNELKGAGA